MLVQFWKSRCHLELMLISPWQQLWLAYHQQLPACNPLSYVAGLYLAVPWSDIVNTSLISPFSLRWQGLFLLWWTWAQNYRVPEAWSDAAKTGREHWEKRLSCQFSPGLVVTHLSILVLQQICVHLTVYIPVPMTTPSLLIVTIQLWIFCEPNYNVSIHVVMQAVKESLDTFNLLQS